MRCTKGREDEPDAHVNLKLQGWYLRQKLMGKIAQEIGVILWNPLFKAEFRELPLSDRYSSHRVKHVSRRSTAVLVLSILARALFPPSVGVD